MSPEHASGAWQENRLSFLGKCGAVPWHDACVSIVIRPADTRDEDALTRIEQETWSFHVSPSVYRSRPFFEDTRRDGVLVALLDDEVAGFVSLRPASPLASNAHVLMIDNLAVAPSAQRKGVASALLEAVETYASERKIERLTLRVLSVNDVLMAKTIEPVPEAPSEAAPADP